MAYVEKRGKRVVTYLVIWRENGHRESEAFDTPEQADAYKDAVIAAGERRPTFTEAEDGDELPKPIGGQPCDFERWALYWHAGKSGVQERTKKDYLSVVRNHLVPAFGRLDVAHIAAMEIGSWINDYEEEGIPAKSIHNWHGVLSQILKAATLHAPIPMRVSNPCELSSLPKIGKPELRPLNRAEYRRLLHCVPAAYRDLVTFLVATGMRWGEATGLRKRFVHLDPAGRDPYARVEYALKRNRRGEYVLGPPKSDAAVRDVPLSPAVVNMLRLLLEDKADNDFVFTAPEGGPVRHQNFYTRVWVPAIERSGLGEVEPSFEGDKGLPSLRIHDLRHTYVNWQLEASPTETTLSKVSTWIGHTSYAFTKDVYGRWVRPDSSKEMAAMARMTRFDDSNVVAIAG